MLWSKSSNHSSSLCCSSGDSKEFDDFWTSTIILKMPSDCCNCSLTAFLFLNLTVFSPVHPTEFSSFFFFKSFLRLTTSHWWVSLSLLRATDLIFIPESWSSVDGPNFDSSPMLPLDFDLLLSSSTLPFDIISGTSNWFDSSLQSVSMTLSHQCIFHQIPDRWTDFVPIPQDFPHFTTL